MKFSPFVFFCVFLLLPFLGKSKSNASDNNNNNKAVFQPRLTETYEDVLARIKSEKRALKANHIGKDSCRTYLLNQFENHIFPYWIGTKWDYNGYANRPGKKQIIACGYFVSTTLKHMGFNWNRYDLAKMYSLKIVEKTCGKITKFTDKKVAISTLLANPDNLYIVGLDSHVGFLLKRGDLVWFIHSNYYGAVGPEKELASVSLALNDSQQYYIGTFFIDQNIDKWLNGTLFNF